MAADATKVLVGQAYAFTAPTGSSYPADDVPVNQGVGGTFTDWTAPWVGIGATQEGVTLGIVQNSNDIPIEEQSTPAQVTINSTDISVAAVLSEDTLETMQLAFGGGTITTTAAGLTQIGKKTLVLAEGVNEIMLGFDGLNQFGFYRRVQIPRVLSVANVQSVYRRAADARRYSVTFRAICKPSEISIITKTANHT
jgi:hypothetical protein